MGLLAIPACRNGQDSLGSTPRAPQIVTNQGSVKDLNAKLNSDN